MADNHFKIHRGVTLAPQSSAPSNPTDGDIYYDSTLNQFRKYENGAWSAFAGGASVDQGVITTDLANAGQTIASGTTLTYPNLTIDTGDTFTINGYLLGFNSITVDGTLTINGDSRII